MSKSKSRFSFVQGQLPLEEPTEFERKIIKIESVRYNLECEKHEKIKSNIRKRLIRHSQELDWY